jgi:hypothetical protein
MQPSGKAILEHRPHNGVENVGDAGLVELILERERLYRHVFAFKLFITNGLKHNSCSCSAFPRGRHRCQDKLLPLVVSYL